MSKDISKNYVQLSETEHILQRAGIYIGSIVNKTCNMYVLDNNKFKEKEVTFNPALLKLFDEIVSNSVDEHIRSGSVTKIKVNIDRLTGTISVYDDGGIPVVKHTEYKKWIPELIFGELRTGSNFDDSERQTAGLNGLGSKLVSVFSTKFIVETCDGKNKFIQCYTDNLSNKTLPNVSPCSDNGTEITFTPDYERLKTELDEDNYNQLIRRCYDIAGCNPKIKVYVNDELIKLSSFKQYAEMFVKSDSIVSNEQNEWSISIAPSYDDTFKQISFVNGINTYEGGTHVDYIVNQVTNSVRDYIKKKHKIDVKPNNIKQQMFIFVKCSVNAPVFNSQTKETLVSDAKTFDKEYKLANAFLTKIVSSKVVENVIAWAEGEQRKQELAELKKINNQAQKKNAIKKIAKFDDATSKDRSITMCTFTEGDSACKPILSARNPKTTGVFPLKGKLLNVRDVSVKKIAANDEIQNILTILGLKLGHPVDYNELRFSKIVCCADMDPDGFHIFGLFLNLFNEFWPELLEKGYLYRLQTPLIVAYNKKQYHEFFSESEYEKWASNKQLSKYTIKYQKGLGGWETKDFKRFLSDDKYLVKMSYTEECKQMLDVAFDKSKADERKDWLLEG